jgi:hypothetical protein
MKAPGQELRGAIQASPWWAGSKDRSTQGVVVMRIQGSGPLMSARTVAAVLTRRNGAAAGAADCPTVLFHSLGGRVLRDHVLPATQDRRLRLPSQTPGRGRNRSRGSRATVSSIRHTRTTDSPAPIGTSLRCCGLQLTRTSTGTSSEGSFAETRSSISSAFKTWACLVRMTPRFCNGQPPRGASSSRTISRRWRRMHSIELQQVSRCQEFSRSGPSLRSARRSMI